MSEETRQENSFALQAVIAIAYGLTAGFFLAVLYWLTDDMAAAYFGQATDVVLLFLQAALNRAVLAGLVTFLLAEGLLFWLKRNVPSFSQKAQAVFVFLFSAGILGAFMLSFAHNLHWFPPLLSKKGVLYAGLFGLLAAAVAGAYLVFRSRNLRKDTFGLLKKPIIIFGVLLLAVNALAQYQKSARREEAVNVIVILIDALRSDHLGCYGYDKATSPALDKFARESVLFSNSFSQSTHTKPSTASLFTSLYPSQHDVLLGNRRDAAGNFFSDVLDESFKTMAEYLSEAGFNSAGFLDQGQLHAYMGFGQGFAYYNTYLKKAKQINNDFYRWLSVNKHRKFFAYLHYLDVHAPYAPPPEYRDMFVTGKSSMVIPERVADWRKFKKKFDEIKDQLTQADIDWLKALYDAEIRALDDYLAALFSRMKEEGVYDNSLIIITADHGDSFMEHGEIDHGTTLYDEVLLVPLLIRFPHGEHAGVIETPVQTIDVLPTILDYVGVNTENDLLMGRSLIAVLNEPEAFAGESIFSERMYLLSIRKGIYKLIYNKNTMHQELYDLSADPREQSNLLAGGNHTAIGDTLKAELLAWSEKVRHIRPARSGVKLDKETVDKLKSLGYIR